MIEELLAGGILLSAMSMNNFEWDDDVGKRFNEELNSHISRGSSAIAEIVNPPKENADEICNKLPKKCSEICDGLQRIRDSALDILREIESI